MLVSRFYAHATRRREHKPGWLVRESKERVRGAIRGAAQRERLLHPSPAKSMQRRIRFRLLEAYGRRFGEDEFFQALGRKRFAVRALRFWLPGGYAWWKERALGQRPTRPFA